MRKSDPKPKRQKVTTTASNPAPRALREDTEDALRRDHSAAPPATPDYQQLLQELRLHQVELETQNEELRRAQMKLGQSADRFTELYDFAPVGYLTLDPQGTLLNANLTLTGMLGIERQALLGSKLSRFIDRADQDTLYLHQQAVFGSTLTQRCELKLRCADGRSLSVQLDSRCIKDAATCQPTARITISDISERKQAEASLHASLREKEALLREIHHRVKNNLQVISSLVGLQADGQSDAAVQRLFSDVRDRVRSMALVHEQLYESPSLAALDFSEYARRLLGYLFRVYATVAGRLRLHLVMQQIAVPVGSAVLCGLILNELVSNALRHAFPADRHGEVTVSLSHDCEAGSIRLGVRDDGIGLPDGFDWQKSSSLGLRLVRMLAEQLGGKVEVASVGGVEFRVIFPAPDARLAT